MTHASLQHHGSEYIPCRVVCITLVPSYHLPAGQLDPEVEAKVSKLIEGLGPSCRVSTFQWLIATNEACGGIVQDLGHEGVDNVFVFSALIGTDWRFWCKPRGMTDESKFDGTAAFLQRQLG